MAPTIEEMQTLTAEKVMHALQRLKEACVSGEMNTNLPPEIRVDLATRACEAATKLEPHVLTEIFGFHASLASHNGAALRGINAGERAVQAINDITLSSLTKNLEDHVGLKKVDEQKMPWQYRK